MERLVTLVQVSNANRTWSDINGVITTANYYCQVIPAQERGYHGTKALNPPPPVLSLGQLLQAVKTDSAGNEIPGFDTATTSGTSVHALKSVVCRSSQEAAYTRLWNFTIYVPTHGRRKPG